MNLFLEFYIFGFLYFYIFRLLYFFIPVEDLILDELELKFGDEKINSYILEEELKKLKEKGLFLSDSTSVPSLTAKEFKEFLKKKNKEFLNNENTSYLKDLDDLSGADGYTKYHDLTRIDGYSKDISKNINEINTNNDFFTADDSIYQSDVFLDDLRDKTNSILKGKFKNLADLKERKPELLTKILFTYLEFANKKQQKSNFFILLSILMVIIVLYLGYTPKPY